MPARWSVCTHRAGLLEPDGTLPRMKEALVADSFAAMFGSVIGTSTTTSYIESAAGVSAGGRTGLTAVFVAMFFLLALFFSPLTGMIPAYASAAALLYVACVMARGLAEMDWDDATEYAPGVVAAITMPLTYSVATGIGLGFVTYALCKISCGRDGGCETGGARTGGAVRAQIRDSGLARQRFLDREEIPPGQTLLQGTAQAGRPGWKVGMARISRLPVL